MPDQMNECNESNTKSGGLDDKLQDDIGRLQQSLRTSRNKADVYRELAHLHYSRRQMDDAINSARKSIRLKRDDVQTRELLLEMLIEINRFDDAIHEAKELLRLSPHSLCARDVLGIAYLQKGMLEKALQIANELIVLDPTSPTNHFKKAVLYQQKGDVGNAIHEFSRVLEMQPDGEMASQAQQAIDMLDSYQLRHIVMLAVEDYIFRTKLIHDPEAAALERGYYLSLSGMSALKQIQFDELPEVYAEWKQRYYH
jgi:tetratricopeptide (TPR) repeat protein